MPPIQKIAVVFVYVNDMRRARSFWEKKVGLKVRFSDKDWVEYDLGGTNFAIHLKDPKVKKVRPVKTTINFQVGSIAKAYQKLSKNGVTFTHPPHEEPFGWLAYFKDADGHEYALFQPRFEF